ncbi:MAG: MotA/TolQ/ExbB proton channel family protein [Phycisphaeraceae bacterium]
MQHDTLVCYPLIIVIQFIIDSFLGLMQRGGWVMWPLLVLSIAAATFVLERAWFFITTNHPGRLAAAARMAALLRRGEHDRARELAARDRTVYGSLVRALLEEIETDAPMKEAAVTDLVEMQRRRLERFMPTLSTIITAAPMLGILGTVLGIIASFEVLAEQTQVTDPARVSQGIAEALITTAAGLLIAVVTLFPYNALRAQVDRTLSRIESLAAGAVSTQSSSGGENVHAESGSGSHSRV